MKELLILLSIIAVWVFVMGYVLPKMGIST